MDTFHLFICLWHLGHLRFLALGIYLWAQSQPTCSDKDSRHGISTAVIRLETITQLHSGFLPRHWRMVNHWTFNIDYIHFDIRKVYQEININMNFWDYITIGAYKLSHRNYCIVHPNICFSRPNICFSRSNIYFSHPNICFSGPNICFSHPNICFNRPKICFNGSNFGFMFLTKLKRLNN